MQDIPDRNVLLQAVAGFLDQQVAPAIADRGLAFRVRIAAHLVMTVARECMADEAYSARQQQGLEDEAELATRIRSGELSEADERIQIEDLKASLAEKLRVVNPRFDLSLEIE